MSKLNLLSTTTPTAAQIMHATGLCIAVHRRTGKVHVLGVGRKISTAMPGIFAWGECESAEEKELKRKKADREESRKRRNPGTGP